MFSSYESIKFDVPFYNYMGLRECHRYASSFKRVSASQRIAEPSLTGLYIGLGLKEVDFNQITSALKHDKLRIGKI